MKLLIVRHGDPDYSIDSLTPKGWREAELLKNRLTKLDVAAFYCSPLGSFGFVVLVEFVEKIKISLGIYAFSCLEPVAVVVVARIVIDIGLQYLRYLQRYFLICHFIASAVFIYILPPK